MKRATLALILVIITCFGMTGCGGKTKLMQPADPMAMNDSVSPEETAIVFYRGLDFSLTAKDFIPIVGPFLSTGVAPIMEISEDEQITHIAYMFPGWKYLHKTTPGRHLYVAGGNPAEILEADMEAGKTYYVGIDQTSGLTTSYEFEPVVDPMNGLPTNFNSGNWYVWTQNSPRGEHWFSKNKLSLQARAIDALNKHNAANPEDKARILPEYGSVTSAK